MSGNNRNFPEALVAHALANVWCTPRQDEQAILKLSRISPNYGVLRQFDLDWNSLALPESGPYFHIYQIGGNLPSDLGLGGVDRDWKRLDEICTSEMLYADLYESDGYHLPLTGAWVCRTDNFNLLVAVRINSKLPELNTTNLYLRLYSSAYFNTPSTTGVPHEIRVRGGIMTTVPKIVSLITDYNALLTQGRVGVFMYLNGVWVRGLKPSQVQVGDVLEFIYDSSIYRHVEVPVGNMDIFTSKVDVVNKYLLHVPKEQNNQIAYRDDLEVYVCKVVGADVTQPGLYYHRNNENGLRMVTHNDYAFPIHHVTTVANRLSLGAPIDTASLRVFFRHSGYDRPLVFEANRIHELYKLNDDQIRKAMTGLFATLPEWQVANLENSWYTYLMRSTFGDFTSSDVIDAYGYNAMSVLSGMSPVRSPEGTLLYPVPLGCRGRTCGVYEYTDGVLTGLMGSYLGEWYQASDGVDLVEFVQALPSNLRADEEGPGPWLVTDELEWRVYRTPSGYAPGNRKWADVTDSEVVSKEGNMVFVDDYTGFYDYRLRTDRNFVTYAFNFNPSDHVFKFDVFQYLPDGSMETMEIPPAKLEMWVNNRRLIPGLDYYTVWPTVVVTNKEFLVEQDNHVRLRAVGFCTEAGELEPVGDFGYVNNGLLSVNNRFNIRDDKSQAYIVYGKVYSRADLKFSETDAGVYLNTVREGAPYLCTNNWVPTRNIPLQKARELYQTALDVDQRVEDYMSLYFPDPVRPISPGIPEFYQTYSPWFCKITWDLKLGILRPENMVTDKQLLDALKPYENLLQFDPLKQEVDTHYVQVHPHSSHDVVEVTSLEFDILRRANRAVMQNKLLLSQFYHVKG